MKRNHPSLFRHQDPATIKRVMESQPNPPGSDITDFLNGLQLLTGVPFQYLVPNPKLLPVESLRFFQVDPNWIACLVDGAYSIGRSTQSDTLHDQVYASLLKAATSTSSAAGVSGLVMRSVVVSGWPNLEICAQDANNNALPLLRLDRLSDTVILCLFSGVIQSVQIQEPSEGLHFGIDINDAETEFTKSLRDTKTGGPLSVSPVSVVFRPGNKRVLLFNSSDPTVATTVTRIQAGLQASSLSGADFALEMVEGVQSVTFNYQE